MEFKETYYKFLYGAAAESIEPSEYKIPLIYYLILQDRLNEAQELLNGLS